MYKSQLKYNRRSINEKNRHVQIFLIGCNLEGKVALKKSIYSDEELEQRFQLSQQRLHESTQELHKTQNEKQELFLEMQALQSQFSVLKNKLLEGQESLKTAHKEKRQLEIHLTDKTQLFNGLESEVSSIKQALSKGMHEAKDIEGRYLGVVNEKASLYNKSLQLEQLLERHNSEISTLQQQLKEGVKKEEALRLQLEQLESTLQQRHQGFLSELQKRINDLESNLQKHHVQLHEKEQEIENNNNQIVRLTQEKQRLEDSLLNVTRYQDEQDSRIKVAQQHLGKKVKEVTLLNEKIEMQQAQISESQASLNQLRTKMDEMQSSFEQQLQQEKRHQEQLHETIRFAEGQVIKWEEKYLKTYEKLKAFEEKQHQIQVLFSSLGTVMEVPQSSRNNVSLDLSGKSEKHTLHLVDTQNISHLNPEQPQQEEKALTPIQPSLFDREQPRVKMRQNLFD